LILIYTINLLEISVMSTEYSREIIFAFWGKI